MRDVLAHRLVAAPANGSPAKTAAANSASHDDGHAKVITALVRLGSEGRRTTRTGKHSLHENEAPEIAGLSRDRLRAILDDLIGEGKVVRLEDGGLAVSGPQAQAEAAAVN